MTKLPENFELDRYGLHVRLVREEDADKQQTRKMITIKRYNPNDADVWDTFVEASKNWMFMFK